MAYHLVLVRAMQARAFANRRSREGRKQGFEATSATTPRRLRKHRRRCRRLVQTRGTQSLPASVGLREGSLDPAPRLVRCFIRGLYTCQHEET